MRHLTLLLAGSLTALACASNNNPPAASSATVAQASNRPNQGPDFAPVSNDGVATAPNETRRTAAENQVAPQPAPNLTPPSESAHNDTSTGTWGSSANGSTGVDTTSGNAAAAPADRSAEPRDRAQPTRPGGAADNTRINERDRSGATLTPMDQGSSEADRKITSDIRKALMSDGNLSFTAKNVKIITIDGKVTLRGPVKTAAERTAIEAAARRVTGNIDSQLEVSK